MTSVAHALRTRFHPLHHLRKSPAFRRLERRIDVPVWARLPGIAWKVRVRLVRHASYLVLRSGPEPRTAALLRAAADVQRPTRFWDVGANFGYYSWLLGTRLPGLEIALFEPDPSNVELIAATIARSGRPFGLHRVAASSVAGTASFALDEVTGATGTLEDAGASFGVRHWGVGGGTIEVPTVRLDAVDAPRPVDLLKLDVEGHEEQALRGAQGILAEDRPLVVFETFDRTSPVFGLLESHGYEIHDSELEDENYLAAPGDRTIDLDALFAAWRREAG